MTRSHRNGGFRSLSPYPAGSRTEPVLEVRLHSEPQIMGRLTPLKLWLPAAVTYFFHGLRTSGLHTGDAKRGDRFAALRSGRAIVVKSHARWPTKQNLVAPFPRVRRRHSNSWKARKTTDGLPSTTLRFLAALTQAESAVETRRHYRPEAFPSRRSARAQ